MRLIQVTTNAPVLINPTLVAALYTNKAGQTVITLAGDMETFTVKEKLSDILRAMSAEVHKA